MRDRVVLVAAGQLVAAQVYWVQGRLPGSEGRGDRGTESVLLLLMGAGVGVLVDLALLVSAGRGRLKLEALEHVAGSHGAFDCLIIYHLCFNFFAF